MSMSLVKTAQFCVTSPRSKLLLVPPYFYFSRVIFWVLCLWARKWMQLGPFPAALAVQILLISPNLFMVVLFATIRIMSEIFHEMR